MGLCEALADDGQGVDISFRKREAVELLLVVTLAVVVTAI
jgi:hypothetical protein